MFPTRRASVPVLVIILIGGLLFSACGGNKTSLAVVVTDYSGTPLNGAKVVSMSQPEGQLTLTGITTKGSNRVTFKGIKAGEYQIQISAPDYVAQDINVTVGDGQEFVARVYLTTTQTVPGGDIQGE